MNEWTGWMKRNIYEFYTRMGFWADGWRDYKWMDESLDGCRYPGGWKDGGKYKCENLTVNLFPEIFLLPRSSLLFASVATARVWYLSISCKKGHNIKIRMYVHVSLPEVIINVLNASFPVIRNQWRKTVGKGQPQSWQNWKIPLKLHVLTFH